MHIEATEVLWFEQHVLSLPELADLSGLPLTTLEELLDCGAITPLELGRAPDSFWGIGVAHRAFGQAAADGF